MRGQEIPSLLIYLFYISAAVQGVTEQETVTGLFSKDCILPCAFPQGNDEVIHWTKGDKSVHSYYHQKDQLTEQDLNYRHRTYLFYQNIPHGNASLKLSNLTVTDEGLYKCYVGTERTRTEVEVKLHVRVLSYYALEYQKIDTGSTLRCCAFLTYTAPYIFWKQGDKSTQETGRQNTTDGVLYSVRSDKNITNTTDPYYCHVLLPHEEWVAEWRMQDQLSHVEGSSAVIPCEVSSSTANTQGFSVVWTLTRKTVTSVLAAFNGTSHSYQPRVQMNQSDFSLILVDLTADDSGEYMCNISSPLYTKLTVRTLQVGKLPLILEDGHQ
ncbi:HERV-H LTR-associating protein 2 [Porphyrio hochstetteri]